MRFTTKTHRGRILLSLLAVSSLALAACGDDDDDTTTGQTATTAGETDETTDTAAVAAEGSPILIAGTLDTAGPSPSGPETGDVIEAWAEYINSKGGINGHPVELDLRETKGDAPTAQSATEELLAKDPVLFFIVSASTETAQGETLGQAEVPLMGVGYAPAVWGGDIESLGLACSTEPGFPLPCALPNAFTITTTSGAVVDEQILGAKAAGATKLAVAACAEVDSCARAEPIFRATTEAEGLEYAGTVKVNSTAGDYTAECIQWVQDGVDFIQISGSSIMGANLIGSCLEQGYEGIFGASAGSVRGDLITIDGVTLAGGLNAFPWWVDDPAVQEYRDVLTDAGISEEGINDPTATGIWSALQLFAKANAELSDNPTGAETLANMYTIKDETLDGLIAPVTFTEGELASARTCFWPYILEDGEFTNPLGGLQYQCYPPEA